MPNPAASAPADIIRSRQNARLKDLRRRLQHPALGPDRLIAVEGDHLVEEAWRSGLRFDTLFLREDRLTENVSPPATYAQIVGVAIDAFNHACATESPQGIAALVEAPQWSFDALLHKNDPIWIVLTGLQDPGNVGTIIRSAEAFAATGVLLTPGSASPWNQKALRASAGSSFRVPVVSLEDFTQLQNLTKKNIALCACVARAGDSLFHTDLRGPIAFVIGNEGAGIPQEILRLCHRTVHVPCPGNVESLNAAIAASILLCETSRQRIGASGEADHDGKQAMRESKP